MRSYVPTAILVDKSEIESALRAIVFDSQALSAFFRERMVPQILENAEGSMSGRQLGRFVRYWFERTISDSYGEIAERADTLASQLLAQLETIISSLTDDPDVCRDALRFFARKGEIDVKDFSFTLDYVRKANIAALKRERRESST